jgi:uncharacterized protein (TIGR02265 family)
MVSALPQTLGRFQLLRKLAVGGMGEVWLARPEAGAGFPERVVVKRLLEHLQEEQEFVTMFLDEARIASALVHPNIARIYDLGEADGGPYIAMEWVRGVSLGEASARASEEGVGLPFELTCRIVADAAAALDFAHAATTPDGKPLALIHRDVSPQNILIGFDGVTRLIDFGVAKAANKLSRTATGMIKGKYAYMSPEQAYDEHLDQRSDIFSLGVVLWEALCGERLFKRESDADTLQWVVDAVIPPPSMLVRRIPKALDELVLQALCRERALRTPTAGRLRQGLETFLRRQRLPATGVHVSALLRDLFPEQLGDEPQAGARRQAAVAWPKEVALSPAAGIGASQLAARLAATAPADLCRGLVFNALISGVARSLGADAEAAVRAAAQIRRPWIDALDYPTADLLRLLWRAAELQATRLQAADAAFESVGRSTMEALLRSTLGESLEGTQVQSFQAVVGALVPLLNGLLAPGQRSVVWTEPGRVTVLFKGEVLPEAFFTGLFQALGRTLFGLSVRPAWERSVARRVELTLQW